MLDRVTGLQVFTRVATEGSLSAAARTMRMSQTMATKHMAALEARLGVKLLHRTTRRLTLTEAGREYLEATERILADLADADAKAAVAAVEVQGTLRLNAPVSFGILKIAPLLPQLARAHPALRIDLALNDRRVDLLEEGWDLVVRIGALADSSLVARRLAPCPTMVCAAPAYLARHGTPRTIADLASHNCLGYTLSRNIGAGRWAFGRDVTVSVPALGTMNANNGDVLVEAAVAGLGIVYQPEFLVEREVADGRLVALVLDHDTVAIDGIFAVYPAERRPPAKVRATIDFLAAKLAGKEPPSPPLAVGRRA